MEEFLTDIKTELPPEQATDVYTTLAKVAGNILRDPCESKYRTLRKDNKLVADNICTSMAAVSLLLLLGFEDLEDAYHCPMTTDLEQMRTADEVLRNMTLNLELLESPSQPTQAPPVQPASGRGALPLKRAPRTSEEERGRIQQEEQLQALRASQREKHRQGAAAAATVAADGELAVAAPPALAPLDLLSEEPQAAATGLAEGGGRGAQAEAEPAQVQAQLDLLSEEPQAQASVSGALEGGGRVAQAKPDTAKAQAQVDLLSEEPEANAAGFAEGGGCVAQADPVLAQDKCIAQPAPAPDKLRECTIDDIEGTALLGAPCSEATHLPLQCHPSNEPTFPSLGRAEALPSEGDLGRKPPPKTLYTFQRRGEGRQQGEGAQAALDELKQLQRERYRQFQSDPHARDAEAYLRPPSGLFDGQSRSSTAPAPATPQEWLSQESKRISQGLKGTSERLSAEFSEASSRFSASLSGVAGQLAANWTLPGAGEVEEPEEACPEVGPLPGRFRVVGRQGALVKQGVAKDTSRVGVLNYGTELVGLEFGKCPSGAPRLRLEAPLCGWLTLKRGIVERVPEEDSAEFG